MNKQKCADVINILAATYPNADTELNFTTNYELLVAVMLSAQCTDKRVNLVNEVVDNADLIGNLCAAENSNEGTLGIFKSSTHYGDFLFNEVAANGGAEVVGNAFGGSMCSVSGTESVVYVKSVLAAEVSKCLCKR